jgi:hypothetical protein
VTRTLTYLLAALSACASAPSGPAGVAESSVDPLPEPVEHKQPSGEPSAAPRTDIEMVRQPLMSCDPSALAVGTPVKAMFGPRIGQCRVRQQPLAGDPEVQTESELKRSAKRVSNERMLRALMSCPGGAAPLDFATQSVFAYDDVIFSSDSRYLAFAVDDGLTVHVVLGARGHCGGETPAMVPRRSILAFERLGRSLAIHLCADKPPQCTDPIP